MERSCLCVCDDEVDVWNKVVVSRKQGSRGLKNGRAEGGASETDGKDVFWRVVVVVEEREGRSK